MIEFTKFDPCHLWLCDGLDINPAYLKAMVDKYENPGFTMISIFKKGRLIGVGGIKHLYPGSGEAFAIFTRDKKSHSKSIVQSVKELLKYSDETLGFYRLQAPIPVDKKTELKFASVLGFKEEGVLKSYCPETRKDCVMMGRICLKQQ